MLLRSAFWLTVGFMVVAPHGTDLGATASAFKDKALAAGMQAGEQLVVSQLLDPKSVASVALHTVSPSAPSIGMPAQSTPDDRAPFPRPRPIWMG